MAKPIRFVGLDVHKDSITLAVAGLQGPVEQVAQHPHDLEKVQRYLSKLAQKGEIRVCYEAGGCGYGLQRKLAKAGIACDVIAPSLVPTCAGDRRKTDKRDAVKLVLALRAGQLTPVRVPSEEEERIRALVRARESLRIDVHSVQQEILKFLLLRGLAYRGKNWGTRFWTWFNQLPWKPIEKHIIDAHLAHRTTLVQLLANTAREVETQAMAKSFWGREAVGRLRCLHGFDTLTAMTVVSEIVDATRFGSPRSMMSFLGLTASEYSSGESIRHGGITKAGNSRVRRVLIEAAWQYRHPPRRKPNPRWEGQRDDVTAYAQKAHVRLHRRYRKLQERKGGKIAVAAIARELVGFVWALMRDEPALLRDRNSRTSTQESGRRRRGSTGATLAAPMR